MVGLLCDGGRLVTLLFEPGCRKLRALQLLKQQQVRLVRFQPGFHMFSTSANRVDVPACYLDGFLPDLFVDQGSLVGC
jgi:hypothetical protein